jgi:hypothetical protein
MIKQMFSDEEQAKAFGAFGPVMGLSAVGGRSSPAGSSAPTTSAPAGA